MYYGRKKAIIIAIIVIILVIALVGVGLFLYLKTDLFKSNQTLFYKYLGEQLETFKVEGNIQLKELEMLKSEMPYTVKGELTIGYENIGEANNETEKMVTELLENLKLTVDGKYDKANEKENTLYKIKYGTQDLFELNAARTNNIYALKSDEIVSNAYVGARNENLKVFAQKLGIESELTQIMPDKLENANVSTDIFAISEQELKHIQDTYTEVITKMIKEDNFSKENNVTIRVASQEYNCNSYRLDLSGEEVKNIVLEILTQLKQDSITLNFISTKAKILGLSEDYTNINKLTTTIQNYINNINKSKLFENGLSIVVYESDGKAVSTEVILKNEVKYTITYKAETGLEKLNVKIDNLAVSSNYETIIIDILVSETSTEAIYKLDIDIDNQTMATLSYESKKIGTTNDVENQISIIINSEDISIRGEYTEKVEFKEKIEDIIELNNTNTAVLNDYTKEQLNAFIPAVIQRIIEVFNEKVMMLNGVTQTLNQQNQ